MIPVKMMFAIQTTINNDRNKNNNAFLWLPPFSLTRETFRYYKMDTAYNTDVLCLEVVIMAAHTR